MDFKEIKQHSLTGSTWLRALTMLAFILFFYFIGLYLIILLITFQFGVVLFTGKPSEPVLPFGQSLSTYVYQVIRYLTYNTDDKPFPFRNWPTGREE